MCKLSDSVILNITYKELVSFVMFRRLTDLLIGNVGKPREFRLSTTPDDLDIGDHKCMTITESAMAVHKIVAEPGLHVNESMPPLDTHI